MVGPPPGIDWSCDWHVILHSWNDRVQRFTNLFHIKTWSRRCVEHYWKLGGYAANLPPERWISRVLAWNSLGRRRSGCPRTSWPSKFISYTRYRHLGNWQVLARDPDLWRGLMDDFCMYCGREWNAVVVCIILWCWFHFSHLRPNGLPTGVQVQSQSQSCATSCRQTFCRTIVRKQSAESLWPVLPLDVSPTSWTKSVSSSKGYGHLKADYCIGIEFRLQRWWRCAWRPPRPAPIRRLICAISIFFSQLLQWTLAVSGVPLSNDLVAKAFPGFQWAMFQALQQTNPMEGVDARAC